MREASKPFLPDGIDLDDADWSETQKLGICIVEIWEWTTVVIEYALERRAEVDAALASRRKLKGLSEEQVRELLRETSAKDAV